MSQSSGKRVAWIEFDGLSLFCLQLAAGSVAAVEAVLSGENSGGTRD